MKSERAISRAAYRLLREAEIDEPPVDVVRAARSLGAEVRYEEGDEEIAGALYRLEEGSAVIGVNSGHHIHRQRFTIAHEIGHLLLHDDPIFVDRDYAAPPVKARPSYLRDRRSSEAVDATEIEANKFAAALLMPSMFIEEELSGCAVPVTAVGVGALAERFRVSEQAMVFRLLNLGVPVDQAGGRGLG